MATHGVEIELVINWKSTRWITSNCRMDAPEMALSLTWNDLLICLASLVVWLAFTIYFGSRKWLFPPRREDELYVERGGGMWWEHELEHNLAMLRSGELRTWIGPEGAKVETTHETIKRLELLLARCAFSIVITRSRNHTSFEIQMCKDLR